MLRQTTPPCTYRCSPFTSPPTHTLEVFAAFTFVHLAVPDEPRWHEFLKDMDCKQPLGHIHRQHAPPNTPAFYWACCVRLDEAYEKSSVFRAFLETPESRLDIL